MPDTDTRPSLPGEPADVETLAEGYRREHYYAGIKGDKDTQKAVEAELKRLGVPLKPAGTTKPTAPATPAAAVKPADPPPAH